MSRIGKLPIPIPSGIDVKVDKDTHIVTVKGKKGELKQKISPSIGIDIEDGELKVTRSSELKKDRAMHGLYRSLINNMIKGVSEGYKLELELVGVGYRANNKGQVLELQVGYSHPIYFVVPNEVKVSTEMVKGKNPLVTLESIDKQLVGQVAAKIRSFRKPEPYKGKGIKFVGEELRRKAGKTASK